MSIRKVASVAALAAMLSPSVFANTGTTWVGGEAGFESHPTQSSRTRTQVLSDLEAFRRNPTTADGGRAVGGEAGFVPHQHQYATRDGQRVHNDQFPPTSSRAADASPAISDSERRAMREQYLN